MNKFINPKIIPGAGNPWNFSAEQWQELLDMMWINPFPQRMWNCINLELHQPLQGRSQLGASQSLSLFFWKYSKFHQQQPSWAAQGLPWDHTTTGQHSPGKKSSFWECLGGAEQWKSGWGGWTSPLSKHHHPKILNCLPERNLALLGIVLGSPGNCLSFDLREETHINHGKMALLISTTNPWSQFFSFSRTIHQL